jgi:hypothetical protein
VLKLIVCHVGRAGLRATIVAAARGKPCILEESLVRADVVTTTTTANSNPQRNHQCGDRGGHSGHSGEREHLKKRRKQLGFQ